MAVESFLRGGGGGGGGMRRLAWALASDVGSGLGIDVSGRTELLFLFSLRFAFQLFQLRLNASLASRAMIWRPSRSIVSWSVRARVLMRDFLGAAEGISPYSSYITFRVGGTGRVRAVSSRRLLSGRIGTPGGARAVGTVSACSVTLSAVLLLSMERVESEARRPSSLWAMDAVSVSWASVCAASSVWLALSLSAMLVSDRRRERVCGADHESVLLRTSELEPMVEALLTLLEIQARYLSRRRPPGRSDAKPGRSDAESDESEALL